MKNLFFPSLRHGINASLWVACCAVQLPAQAGGIDIFSPPPALHVTIPAMKGGLGFSVEGSALRVYENDLSYITAGTTTVVSEAPNTDVFIQNSVEKITPGYAPAIRASIDYTFSDYANVISLVYEHLFSRDFTSSVQNLDQTVDFSSSMRQKLDTGAILSEQHILIGPFWETTLTGGVLFAHLEQTFSANGFAPSLTDSVTSSTIQSTMQFNGVGPLLGMNAIINMLDYLSFGAEIQGALLLGKNNLSIDSATTFVTEGASFPITNTLEPIYALAPELYYRIYANLFFRAPNNMEFQFEGGWRANQFFNLRTFDRNPLTQIENVAGMGINSTVSNDLGFSGPYVRVHIQL